MSTKNVSVGTFWIYLLERTCICICHHMPSQGMLKFRAHESIPFARIFQNQEMDLEHGHIEEDRNDDEAESTGAKMFDPKPR